MTILTKFNTGDKVFALQHDEKGRRFACPAQIVRVTYDKWAGGDPFEHIEYTSIDLLRGGYIEHSESHTSAAKDDIMFNNKTV